MNAPATNPSPRVLLVDDNAAIHQDFRKILLPPKSDSGSLNDLEESLFDKPKAATSQVSFRLDSAYQGQEALALVQKSIAENDPYSLVFMDIRMPPGWDGVETVERIWQICPDLQVVLCSAYSDYTWDDLISKFGHTDNLIILKKPFETVEVLQMTHALTKKWTLTLQSRLWVANLDRLVRERTRDLVAANESLRISEERFAKAFRTSPMPMAIVTRTGSRFVDTNAAFQKLSGHEADQLLSSAVNDLGLWTDYTHRKITSLETGSHLRNHTCTLRSKDGASHEIVLWAEPVALDCGDCVLLIVEDVTDQLRLETQLRQAQKMEAVGRLAAGVAHEFNNILTVIQGHAELLRNENVGARQVADSGGRISQASQRAAALTRQLLTFSRQQPVQLKPLNLSAVVNSTQNMLRQLLGEKYNLQIQCAGKLPLVLADEGNMEQILINLCINARDAMSNGGNIRVETGMTTLTAEAASRHPDARPGEFVSISVTDTGCGISSELLRRVFDPFFTTKEVGKGTGLGLSTVHGIVRQHQGWIEAISQPGQGSTFIVFLPAAKGNAPATQNTSSVFDLPPQTGNGEGILVVEDDPSVRELAKAALERSGYKVFESADGESAIKVWDESGSDIALLITDMVLPRGMSGGRLAAALRKKDPELRAIYISGYGSEMVKDELPETFAPGVNFLSKPFDPQSLLKAVAISLDRTAGTIRPAAACAAG